MARPALKKFTALPILIIALALFSAKGQEYNFRHLTSDNGLSSNNIHVIVKDSRGFVWIGTDNGLNRFDGYNFSVFKNDPGDSMSLISGNIYAIKELKNGDLLVGTCLGLNRFNHCTEKFTLLDLGIKNKGANSAVKVRAIVPDSGSVCWIGSYHGLSRIDLASGSAVNFLPDESNPSDSSNCVTAIYKESENKLWVGTRDGLFHFDPVKEIFSPVTLVPDWYYIQPFDRIIHCFYMDSMGILWIGTHWFLYRYENGSFDWIGPPGYVPDETAPNSNAINAIAEHYIDGKQVLWMATWGGINYYDPAINKYKYIFTEAGNPDALSSYALSTQFLDDEGLLWIGHEDRGVDILNLNENPFKQPVIDSTGSNLAALSFLMDSRGDFWAGMDDHGLIRMDPDMNFRDFYRFRLPGGVEMQNCDLEYLFEDSRGLIWVANALLMEGLYLFDPEQRCFGPVKINVPGHMLKQAPGPVRYYSIKEDRNGVVWYCTSHGLFRSNTGNPEKITAVFFSDNDSLVELGIRCILEDQHENLWVGTENHGLLCIRNGNEDLRYQDRWELTDLTIMNFKGIIYSILGDQDLWLGTSSGLCKIHHNDSVISQVQGPDGLIAGNPVYGIIRDNNDVLWLNTQAGLVRFDPHPERGLLTRKFDESDGLPFENFSPQAFYQSNDGRIFMGGVSATGNSFIYFNPDEISDNRHVPQIVITGFRVRNKNYSTDSSILVKKNIRLAHDRNFFSFEFAALDYASPERNQYAYYLEGLEDGWINSGNRRYVSYSSVPPGNYIFRVKGSNNNGYWNEAGVSLSITVMPPPWKCWWAFIIYGIVIAAMVAAWRKYDLKRQQIRHQLAVEHMEAEKLKELDHMKSRFFANISHEFRTPLTLVLGPLENMIETAPETFRKDLAIMRRNARRLQQLIDQLLMLSKIESGQMKMNVKKLNIVKLVNGYVQSFESLAKHRNIELFFQSSEDELIAAADREKIEKTLFNLLSNAFKFTGEGGKIEVSVGRLDSWTVIKVSDTGPGISPEHLPRIFDRFYQADDSPERLQEGTGIGLSLVKELVELHHGSISVESNPGKGTEFTILLPLDQGPTLPTDIIEKEITEAETEEDISALMPEQNKAGMHKENIITKPVNNLKDQDTRSKPVILIVEDNADLREYIKGFLESHYKLLEAANGKDGFKVSVEYIPDLIISDVMMPEMDGFELCKMIKTDERTSHIPVILLTARAEQESKLEGLETGADDFITKPFDPLELQIRVKNLLDQRKKLNERFMQHARKAGLSMLINMPGEEIQSMDERFMEKAVRIVLENLGNPEFTVEDFASGMALSHVQLHRKLVALTGQPANRIIRSIRLTKAAQLIRNKSGTITEIAYEVGFNNLSWFARCFHEQFGQSPSEYASQPGKM